MEKKRSLWPYLISGFLAIVFLVNFTMLALAIKSDDGLTDSDYYEKGLFYTSRMKAEAELGWKIGLSFTNGVSPASKNPVRIEVTKDGSPVKGAVVRVVLKRPATNRFDAGFDFIESGESGGLYSGTVVIPSAGFWDFDVVAEKDGRSMERVFRIKV